MLTIDRPHPRFLLSIGLVLLSVVLLPASGFAEASVCADDCRAEMLTMAYIANLSAHVDLGSTPDENAQARITATTVERISYALSQGYGKIDTDWDLAWGPVVITKPNKQPFINANGQSVEIITGEVPANTMFVAQHGGSNTYVVAIAGTNARSDFAWKNEDFDAYPVQWPGSKMLDFALVTRGTLTGLHILQNMRPEISGYSGGAQMPTILDFLKNVAANSTADNKATIYVTGHSLGGALAPALALWLHDERSAWDPKNHTTLQVFAFAGATPGNTGLASYAGDRFPGDPGAKAPTTDGMKIVNNSLDVVPHAFNLDTLKEISNLYKDVNIYPGTVEKELLHKVIAGVQKAHNHLVDYQTFGSGAQVQGITGKLQTAEQLHPAMDLSCPILPGAANAHLDNFALEALYQHVCAYPLQLGMPNLLLDLAECTLKYPNG